MSRTARYQAAAHQARTIIPSQPLLFTSPVSRASIRRASCAISQPAARVISKRKMEAPSTTTQPSEATPLLGDAGADSSSKKPFYRPRPIWLVPFAIVASIVRGMTLAPRVQVFTQLSCNAVYGHDIYDHTSSNHTFPVSTSVIFPSVHTYLDPAGPSLDRHLAYSSDSHSLDNIHRASSFEHNVFFITTQSEKLDPRSLSSKRCTANPEVQAGAARLQTTVTTIMGVLSALTTGWWGHYGERHGRMRVLAASTLGLLLTDLTFILVSMPHNPFAANGQMLLVLAPIVEGFLGGWSTLQAATSAYVSDCTSDGSRAHIFSRFTGVFYLGFSLGPTLGAYLIRNPIFTFPGGHSSSSGHSNDLHSGQPMVTSVFYVAAMCSFVNLLLVLFVFPESLHKKSKSGKIIRPTPSISEENNIPTSQGQLERMFSSLKVFLPRPVSSATGARSTDWSLTILGVALFMYMLSTGVFQIKYLYAEHVYEWGAEQLSYYITLMGGIRAVHLLFVMPYLIATFKPKPKDLKGKAPQQPPPSTSVSVPVHHTSLSEPSAPTAAQKKPRLTLLQLMKDMNFDLIILRVSFLIDLLSHVLVSVAPVSTGEAAFVGFTALSSLGAGVIPVSNSLALCILQLQVAEVGESGGFEDASAGKLFGALATLQSIGQMILGPLIFGIVYSSTVATFPKAIFTAAAGIAFVALALLFFIRPDQASRVRQQRRARRDEEEADQRGRSRVSKDISQGPRPMFIAHQASGGSSSLVGPSSSYTAVGSYSTHK